MPSNATITNAKITNAKIPNATIPNAPVKVLLVEDNASDALLLSRLLGAKAPSPL